MSAKLNRRSQQRLQVIGANGDGEEVTAQDHQAGCESVATPGSTVVADPFDRGGARCREGECGPVEIDADRPSCAGVCAAAAAVRAATAGSRPRRAGRARPWRAHPHGHVRRHAVEPRPDLPRRGEGRGHHRCEPADADQARLAQQLERSAGRRARDARSRPRRPIWIPSSDVC